MNRVATIHLGSTRGTEYKAGDLFILRDEKDPYMLIEWATGPDIDHVAYNMLNLRTGTTSVIGGYDSIPELMEADSSNFFTKLDSESYVVLK